MSSILRINNLHCGYKDFSLKEINLEVEEGSILGIIGPNGSGKTTLLRAISGIIKPKAGAILLEGRNLMSMSPGQLAREIAVVNSGFGSGAISVEEYVLLGRTPHYGRFQFLENRRDLEIVNEALELTDSGKVKDHSILEVSSGERQLAAIARALVQEPRLLLLDEPTSHLDLAHQVRILDLIHRLQAERQFTVVMVLHDLNLASHYCQRLILLDQGAVVKSGSPREVISEEIISQVYQTPLVVKKNPVSGAPHVFLIPTKES